MIGVLTVKTQQQDEAMLDDPYAHDLVEHPLDLQTRFLLRFLIVINRIGCVAYVLELLGLSIFCWFVSFELPNQDLKLVCEEGQSLLCELIFCISHKMTYLQHGCE